MASKKGNRAYTIVLHKYPNPASFYAGTAAKDRVSPAIVVVTAAAAAFLPRKPIGGDIIQIILLVSLIFAFSFGFSAMFLQYHQKPKAARIFKISAAIWMCSASAMFLCQILH